MKTLGVSMIVRNESANIRDCLESVKDADEIVIVDTGSEDDTVEICKQYTDKVYHDPWRDDFSYSRNVSLGYCNADYVLIIDADERLVTPIKKLKQTINEFWIRKYFGLYFIVQMKYELFESPRLFKNCDEIYYIDAGHNRPTWNGDPEELKKRLYKSTFIIESGYSEAHKKDPDRTMRILKKSLKDDPDNTRTLYYLAREYLNHKDVKKAVRLLEKYRSLKLYDCDKWDNELADVLYLLALCYVDPEAWGRVRWFDAVQSSLWSHSVLPTSRDNTEFLSRCFSDMPGSINGAVRMQELTVNFWKRANEEADDRGVLMKRKFDD